MLVPLGTWGRRAVQEMLGLDSCQSEQPTAAAALALLEPGSGQRPPPWCLLQS